MGDTFITADEEKLPQPPFETGWIHIFAVIGCPLSKYAVPDALVACAPDAAPIAIRAVSAPAATAFLAFLTIFIRFPILNYRPVLEFRPLFWSDMNIEHVLHPEPIARNESGIAARESFT
ncbi:hypothetical protein ACSBOX_02355 [Arthrobacter sp. KN11-1C]|uniref:hypothetical protein n=1 Tax=Arthrobacter sp. KN11-1C TaxID=3445774 RepID=UPI003FA1108B